MQSQPVAIFSNILNINYKISFLLVAIMKMHHNIYSLKNYFSYVFVFFFDEVTFAYVYFFLISHLNKVFCVKKKKNCQLFWIVLFGQTKSSC